ncbi:MAG: ferritin family protein [Actinomycetota bacterium]|nr:ferritin family protein [Actinomycetota bacterium]
MNDISTLKGVIDFALEKESEAEAQYANLAKLMKSDRLAGIFTELAAEERKHYETLQNLDVGLVANESIKPVPDLKISDYMHDVSYSPEMSFQDILVLAMKAEEHSHSLYQGLADHTGDAELKKLFAFMAMQEATHKLRLETEYDDYILTQD